MTRGVLGIIICPMNDDPLLHFIRNDSDVDRVILLQNEHSDRILGKLESSGIPFDVVPEQDFDEGRMVVDHDKFNIVIKANNLALHGEPTKLRARIEEQVRQIQPLVDVVGLYYGTCGNAGWDMEKWASEQNLKPLCVFRGTDGKVCDDCVALAVGGQTRYRQLEREYVGMFYLTPAIADNWVDFVSAGDDADQFKNIPPETLDALGIHSDMDFMRWLFELGHYKNVLKLYTGITDRAKFDAQAEDIGKVLNLKPIEAADGWVTLDPSESLYNRCKHALPQ